MSDASQAARRPTAAEVRIALAKHFPHPEYGIVFEVAQGTGHKAHRHLDAMAMGLWPSRGLVLIGVEIKVTTADFRTELRNPAKAEEMARFCDYFYVAAPVGIVPIAELPKNWGLLEMPGTRIKERMPATRLSPQPITKDFLAAVFRAASRPRPEDEIDAIMAERGKALEEHFNNRVQNAVDNRHDTHKHDAEQWRKVCDELGITGWRGEAGLVKAIRLVHALGIASTYSSLTTLLNASRRMLAELEPIAAEIDAANPEEKKLI